MVAARELIAGYGKWVEAVPERQSLLVEACGRVIGFFPVDELTLAEATNPADKSRRLAQR